MQYQIKLLDLIDSVLMLLDDDEYDMAASLAHMRRIALLNAYEEDVDVEAEWRESVARTVTATYARDDWTQDVDFVIPEAKPVPGRVSKPPAAKTFKCPRCGAKPGKPCFKLTHRGHGGTPTDTLLAGSQVHEERRARARSLS